MSMSNRAEVQALFDLSGRVAIVTGGSRGIGFAIANGFALAGARVVIASRKAEACGEAVQRIEASGAQALAVPTHVGDPEALEGLVERTVEHFGQLDIVVNNAANALALPMGQITLRRGRRPRRPTSARYSSWCNTPCPTCPRAGTRR
jgi:NAD(P)-dependent dehydrogenase (short-subunit alcohol dehydrogenase family)